MEPGHGEAESRDLAPAETGGQGESGGPAEGSFGQQLADTLGGPPFTADPVVDAALAGAAAAQDLDPAEQLEVYVGTHRALQDRLADSGA
jgi:hypothetical protein